MRIRSAASSDLAAVERLLTANDLPLEGVRDNFESFVVAVDDDTVVGAVGLERFDSAALLRSAVVRQDARGSGTGQRLIQQILERAEREGIDEIYLLTTTAENYFPRFGFSRTTRAAVPDAVKASAEFQGACPETAVVMERRIGAAARAHK